MKTQLTAILLILASGCTDQPVHVRSTPELRATRRLSPEIQRQLSPFFDVPAAEEYFQTMSPSDVDRVLAGMGFFRGSPPLETHDVIVPIYSSNPRTQSALDRMLRPYWRLPPPPAVDAPFPGRDPARTSGYVSPMPHSTW